jgi:hypothetical protein
LLKEPWQAMTTTKFRFRIRTRHGLVVDRLAIHGRDEADAARKLRQMYQHCEILSTVTQSGRPAVRPDPSPSRASSRRSHSTRESNNRLKRRRDLQGVARLWQAVRAGARHCGR